MFEKLFESNIYKYHESEEYKNLYDNSYKFSDTYMDIINNKVSKIYDLYNINSFDYIINNYYIIDDNDNDLLQNIDLIEEPINFAIKNKILSYDYLSNNIIFTYKIFNLCSFYKNFYISIPNIKSILYIYVKEGNHIIYSISINDLLYYKPFNNLYLLPKLFLYKSTSIYKITFIINPTIFNEEISMIMDKLSNLNISKSITGTILKYINPSFNLKCYYYKEKIPLSPSFYYSTLEYNISENEFNFNSYFSTYDTIIKKITKNNIRFSINSLKVNKVRFYFFDEVFNKHDVFKNISIINNNLNIKMDKDQFLLNELYCNSNHINKLVDDVYYIICDINNIKLYSDDNYSILYFNINIEFEFKKNIFMYFSIDK